MTLVRTLSDDIKSEAKAYELTLEDQGRTPSEIAKSVIPTPKSYRDATSPTRKGRPAETVKVQQGEDADSLRHANQAPAIGPQQGEYAGASQSSGSGLERGEDASAGQTPGTEGALGENADDSVHKSEEADKRVGDIMKFVSDFYTPDDSKMFMKGDQQFILPPWATDQNIAKCAFCGRTDKAVRPEGTKGKLTCSGAVAGSC